MLTMQYGQKQKHPNPAAARATLRGTQGALRVEVLGYAYPDEEEGPDPDWLLVRLELEDRGRHFTCEGPMLLADELATWGARTKAPEAEARMFTFIEPNLGFGWSRPTIGGSRAVRIEVFCESRGGNARVDATLRVTDADLVAFGRSLLRAARLFPVRSTLIASRVS